MRIKSRCKDQHLLLSTGVGLLRLRLRLGLRLGVRLGLFPGEVLREAVRLLSGDLCDRLYRGERLLLRAIQSDLRQVLILFLLRGALGDIAPCRTKCTMIFLLEKLDCGLGSESKVGLGQILL